MLSWVSFIKAVKKLNDDTICFQRLTPSEFLDDVETSKETLSKRFMLSKG